jgi:DNA-binding Lrp family transcriptional regulator
MPDDGVVDDVDLAILQALQDDARNNTNAAISQALGVAPSTVGKRIRRLEAAGIIRGYVPLLAYDLAGFPLHMLFVCTAPIADRPKLAAAALALDGVVEVRELMTGEGNLHVRTVAASADDVTGIAAALDELGVRVIDEILVRSDRRSPLYPGGSGRGGAR